MKIKLLKRALAVLAAATATMFAVTPAHAADPAASGTGKKPNILVIWGDDIGIHNISAYSLGLMGYHTPNIDRIAKEGAMFTDFYAQQSCTAGRASFILGQHPFRTGLLTIGMPGSPHGIPDWTPTIADLLKPQGYATGQFGKNHLGDRLTRICLTMHGFDEFLGNLYHLNAEEEPQTYYYPKGSRIQKTIRPARRSAHLVRWQRRPKNRRHGPAHARAHAHRCHGDLSRPNKVREEIGRRQEAVLRLVQHHPHARLDSPETLRPGPHRHRPAPDGMVEHDDMVGDLLKTIDDLKIADNTIVIYGTDNGAEVVSWPDGGTTPFHGEKGTTWEGGFRVPCMIRWPGVIKPGTIINDIMSQEDWMPTFLAAAGEPDIVEKLKNGYEANGKTWKVHADGYNFLPFFRGEVKKGPREEIFYFGQGGDLNAVRWNDWKVSFALENGNIATAVRGAPGWPEIVNLRADPYEKAPRESGMYIRWCGDNIWLFVPVQKKLKEFLVTLPEYPFQPGSSLNAANINYNSLQAMQAMKRLHQLESLESPTN